MQISIRSVLPRIHVVSATDASDPAMDGVGLQGLETLETLVGRTEGDVAADALLRRSRPSSGAAALAWAGRAVLAFGPALVGCAAGSAALAGVGAAFGLGLAVTLLVHGRGSEPAWSGVRTYEVAANRSRKVDSRPSGETPADGAGFLAGRMAKFPQALKVVHLAGHGRAYRQAAGLPFDKYRGMLEEARTALGRPLDLLLVDSCMQGNLEALAGTWPCARFALVAEETQPGGQMPRLLEEACRDLPAGPVAPDELGRRIVAGVRSWQDEMGNEVDTAHTLALVDMPKVPALVAAVDHLGRGLANEVREGRGEQVLAALEGVRVFPSREGEEQRNKLRFGDLKGVAARVGAAFPGALGAAADAVMAALDAAVVGRGNGAGFEEASGISVQLPGAEVDAFEASDGFQRRGWIRHRDSAAPRGWKDFLEAVKVG